ncbi:MULTISPECIES: hypothetical protein [Chryseobacterium]|uniref:DUF304 domain-containing protein n=1 Tax=Chryseobacterium camelliae TaxID=1265445 RepID=A0ABU0THD5_9FLAO|nr:MULTISPECIES: hypothetical protein [Chryseobacterium]MDT3405726.1 hypothetical protein [Pseudacidovorax intermedius]MDQ1096465.1 hypothetical protein [Chryseobacterium camelliae]MDQ1100405.1 hypothetical protein [Chryseobacterium sp. SORGH_AS_1048]MDR6087746.1 hypothetical protein [Chryseobacterium sp. SORGH_AS_0909]MDR6132122.1 hypothetical protein [Chryseobacterium sp. SORGH_AS_1175]
MRLSNRNKASLYNFINTLLLIITAAGFAAFFLEEYKFNIMGWESTLFIIIPLFLLLLFYFSGRQIFEYDSDGEALHFRNRNVIPFLGKPLSDEFPKYKLISFDVVSIFFIKRLYVRVTSKNSGSALLKYEVSYLTGKEINDLKISLNKVVKANNDKKTERR